MKKKYLILLIVIVVVLILLIIALLFGFLYWRQQKTLKALRDKERETQQSDNKTQEPTKTTTSTSAKKESTLVSIDDTWNQYTNYSLGFSIKVPKEMVHIYGACQWNEEQQSYRPEEKAEPVKIFEDLANKTVYISSEYYYKLSGKTERDERDYFSGCDKVTNSLSLLQEKDNTNERFWAIKIPDITSTAELEKFIKTEFYSDCVIGEQKPSSQEGVFDVGIEGEGESDPSNPSCFINGVVVLKYYPQKNIAALWGQGQAFTFYLGKLGTDNEQIFDDEMAKSFKFL